MTSNPMLEAMRQDQVLLGLCNMYPAAGVVEGMCGGWDFVWIDGQHGQMSYDAVLAAMRAAAVAGVQTLVRVPGHEPGIMGPIADLCPAAVMVPMVNDVRQAEAVVQALRFPPHGMRSDGGRRVIDLAGRTYFQDVELAIVAQIETPQAVKRAEQIAAVEGVDVLFFGPDDMKVQMGLPIDTPPAKDTQLRELMQQTAEAAKRAGKFSGCVAPTGEGAQLAAEMGYQLIVSGADSGFIRSAAAAKLQEVRRALGETVTTPAKTGSGIYS